MNPAALADAGVKFLFTGHAGQLSISGYSTNNGAQMYDVMSGSLVNASSSVRFTTLSKASAGMKEQRAEFTTSMIASADALPMWNRPPMRHSKSRCLKKSTMQSKSLKR